MACSLKGKTLFITGASRGIGQAIALKLAQNGAFVFGTATTEQGAASIDAFFDKEQLKGRGLVLDVTNSEQIEQLMDYFSNNQATCINIGCTGVACSTCEYNITSASLD